MVLTDPSPLVCFSPTTPTSDTINITGATWFYWGVNQASPMQPLLSDKIAHWVESNEYPSAVYMGKQHPLWTIVFSPNSGYFLYQILPNESRSTSLHTHTYHATPSSNALPEYSIYMRNASGIQDTAWALFWAKNGVTTIESSIVEPLSVSQTWFGRVPWVYDQTYCGDGKTAVTNQLITANPTDIANVIDIGIDGNTEITYDGSPWEHDIIDFKCTINRGCTYQHAQGTSHQENVWPSAIYEGNTNMGAYVDLSVLQGKENTIMKDIYSTGGETTEFSVKMYNAGTDKTYYFQVANVGSTTRYHSSAEMNVPLSRESLAAAISYRFLIKQPEFKMEDGVASDYSGK